MPLQATQRSFLEMQQQMKVVNDLILSDLERGDTEQTEYIGEVRRHTMAVKTWFMRLSYANKRQYLLTLLKDIRSAWCLSILLEAIWNCRTKDAVSSGNRVRPWSIYDQVPLDNNRTAIPTSVLGLTMKHDREWFNTLGAENQALFLGELLAISGGPLMLEMLRKGQKIYDCYRDYQMQTMQEWNVVETKEQHSQSNNPATTAAPSTGSAKDNKMLEESLDAWNKAIQNMKDTMKLQEIEFTFADGRKQKIWKVNRPPIEVLETMGFIQLLPSAIAKRIFMYLPIQQLNECTRVNKYWAFLIEELKKEQAARVKVDSDLAKMKEILKKREIEIEEQGLTTNFSLKEYTVGSSSFIASANPTTRDFLPSYRSERSTAAVSHSSIKIKPTPKIKQKPISSLYELDDRLARRGAADENLWHWCENVVRFKKGRRQPKATAKEGVLQPGKVYFPCPLMKQNVKLLVTKPFTRDPAYNTNVPVQSLSDLYRKNYPVSKNSEPKRHNLWSRNYTGLFTIPKMPSYGFIK